MKWLTVLWRTLFPRIPRRCPRNRYEYAFILVLLCGCTTVTTNPFPFPDRGTNVPVLHGMGLRKQDVRQLKVQMNTVGVVTPGRWTRPPWINNSGYFTPISDQGQTPCCTAYALEYVVKAFWWRTTGTWLKDDLHTRIYMEAQRLDGSYLPGASMESALIALTNLDLGLGTIRTTVIPVWDSADVPYSVHRYGAVFAALDITDQWARYYRGTIPAGGVYLGPHAQVITGYDDQRGTLFGVNSWGPLWGREGFWEMTADEFDVEYAYGYVVRITFDTAP